MEARLLEAARSNNLDALYDLFRQDPAIFQKLHCLGSGDTPLHLASILGRVEFVRKYIELGSITDHQLCQLNRDGCSPLHLASANGHFHIVKHMLDIAERSFAAEKLCLKKDKDGRTALHCAAAAGKIDVIGVLLAGCSQAAMEVSVHGESVLHITVKHRQHEALVWLIHKLDSSAKDLLNQGDREGNTVVHLATAQGHLQMVEFLVKQPGLKVNAKNSNGQTALDIISTISCSNSYNDVYVQGAIREAGGCLSEATNTSTATTPASNSLQDGEKAGNRGSPFGYPKEIRSGLMVMASIVVTLTFQVALILPGGVWQDWGTNTSNSTSSDAIQQQQQHKPGQSILYDLSPKEFIAVMAINFQAFFASICTIIVLLSSSDSVDYDYDPARDVSFFVQVTVAFTVADFLMIMSVSTAVKSRLIQEAEFLAPLILWVVMLYVFLFVFFMVTDPRYRGSITRKPSLSRPGANMADSLVVWVGEKFRYFLGNIFD